MRLKKLFVPVLCFLVMFTFAPSLVFAETVTGEEAVVSTTETDITTEPTTDTTTTDTTTTQTTTTETTTDTTEDTVADTDEAVEEEAGVTPDNWLYSIEQMIESVQVSLTFSEEGKAELLIGFANERLAEAAVMSEEDKQDLVQQVLQVYSDTMKKANLQVQQIIDDTEATTEDQENAEETTGETVDETAVVDEEAATTISSLIDSIETVQSNAEEIVIELTGGLTEEQADLMTSIITAEVQNTIALKAYVTAKQGFVESVQQFAQAKAELEQARISGDEAAILAAEAKVQEAEQYKNDMQDFRKDVHELKVDVMKENKEVLKEQKEAVKEWKKDNKNQVVNDDEISEDEVSDVIIEADEESDVALDSTEDQDETEGQINTVDSVQDKGNKGKGKK